MENYTNLRDFKLVICYIIFYSVPKWAKCIHNVNVYP